MSDCRHCTYPCPTCYPPSHPEHKGAPTKAQKQLAQAKAKLKETVAGRTKVYRAWEDTWTSFHENPTAYHKAYAQLRDYDIAKNRVVDEVKRLETLVEEEK